DLVVHRRGFEQRLQRDANADREVLAGPDLAHSAGSDLAIHAISACDDRAGGEIHSPASYLDQGEPEGSSACAKRQRRGKEGVVIGRSADDSLRVRDLEREVEQLRAAIALLHRIANLVRAALELEPTFYSVLTAVTAGVGLGMNRAMLF